MTIQELLELNLHWRILVLCSIPICFAIILQRVTQHSPIAGFFQSYVGVVGPHFVSVGILFALFATFLGADIWSRVQASNPSLEHEAGALQSLRQIATGRTKERGTNLAKRTLRTIGTSGPCANRLGGACSVQFSKRRHL